MHWLAEVASNLWFVVKQLTIISAQIVLAIMVLLTVISVILSLIRLVKKEVTKGRRERSEAERLEKALQSAIDFVREEDDLDKDHFIGVVLAIREDASREGD